MTEGSEARRFAESWKAVVEAWNAGDDDATLRALRAWIGWWDRCFWNGDFSAFPAAYHSNVQLENHTRLRGLSIFRGGEGIEAFQRLREESADVLSWFEFHIESIERSGDRVVALGTMRTRGRLSGLGVGLPFATLWTISEKKISRAEGFTNRRVALRSLRDETE